MLLRLERLTAEEARRRPHSLGYFETRNTWSQLMAFEVKGEDILFTTRQPYANIGAGRGR